MSPVEKMQLILYGLAILCVVIAAFVLLSQLNKERLGALANLRELAANNATYATTAIAIGTEFYNAYRYDTGVNWVLILTLLGITTTAAKIGRTQETLKVNTEATKNTADSVDLVLNTMPIGPKNPVAATRTQVDPAVTPVHPSSHPVTPHVDPSVSPFRAP